MTLPILVEEGLVEEDISFLSSVTARGHVVKELFNIMDGFTSP